MLKVDDVRAITIYCRVLGNSARQTARVFQRSCDTIARVLKEGAMGLLPGGGDNPKCCCRRTSNTLMRFCWAGPAGRWSASSSITGYPSPTC